MKRKAFNDTPLPPRKAFLVWIACALAGWVVALVVIYAFLRFGDPMIAEQDATRLRELAPAAGDSKTKP